MLFLHLDHIQREILLPKFLFRTASRRRQVFDCETARCAAGRLHHARRTGIDATLAALRLVTPVSESLEATRRPSDATLTAWGVDGGTAGLLVDLKASAGTPRSLADNVVLVVRGDTPKNAFNRNGWGDGTPGGSNQLHVRGNGFLKSGWFGRISPILGRTNFDPADGVTKVEALAEPATTAALLGVRHAITRGNVSAVTAVSSATYAGVVAASPP